MDSSVSASTRLMESNGTSAKGSSSSLAPVRTVDEVISEIPLNKFHYILLVLCGLGFSVDAMEIILLSFINPCAGAEFKLENAEIAAITSAVFAGQLFGSMFWGPFADTFGRRKSYITTGCIIVVAGWLSGFAANYGQLLVLRFIVGVGVGGSTVPFDIFAEFLPHDQRGSMLMYTNIFWVFGELYVTGAAYLTLQHSKWRHLVFASAVPVTIAVACAFMILPESPRWLLSQGRVAEAEEICRSAAEHSGVSQSPFRFAPVGGIEEDAETSSELVTKTDSSKNSLDNAALDSDDNFAAGDRDSDGRSKGKGIIAEQLDRYWQILGPKELRVITCKIGLIWLVFGFGYYSIVLLITRIYQHDSSTTHNENAVCSFDYGPIAINTSAETIGVIGSALIIDRWGRRGTQMSSYALTGVMLFVLGAFHIHQKTEILVIGFIMRAMSMASSCATWVMTPELYPTNVRATAHSMVNALARVGGLASPFLVVSTLSEFNVAVILGCLYVVAATSAWSLHETAGKAMDDKAGVSTSASAIGNVKPGTSDSRTRISTDFSVGNPLYDESSK